MTSYRLALSENVTGTAMAVGDNIFFENLPHDYKVYVLCYPGTDMNEELRNKLTSLGEQSGKNLLVNFAKLNDPNYAPALKLKGFCLQAVGKYSEGEDNLNRAISLMLQNFENLGISEKVNLAEMLVIARRYKEGGKYAREAFAETQDAGYKCILNVIILSSNLLAKDLTSSYLLAEESSSSYLLEKDSINSTEKEFSTFLEEYKNLDECFECKDYWDFSELIHATNRVANLQTKFFLLSIIDLLQGNIDKHKLSFFSSF
jgi:tetratricopeptide (TPR) repeat protein